MVWWYIEIDLVWDEGEAGGGGKRKSHGVFVGCCSLFGLAPHPNPICLFSATFYIPISQTTTPFTTLLSSFYSLPASVLHSCAILSKLDFKKNKNKINKTIAHAQEKNKIK